MVQSRPRLEPLELIRRHRVLGRNGELFAVGLHDADGDLTVWRVVEQVGQSQCFYDVSGPNARVVSLVSEPQGKNTLFLQSASVSIFA